VKPRPISADERERIASALRNTTLTFTEIGAQYDRSFSSIKFIAHQIGVTSTGRGNRQGPVAKSRNPVMIENYKDIIAAYESGVGMTTIADCYGVSTGAVSGLLRRAGVEIRQVGRALGKERALIEPPIFDSTEKDSRSDAEQGSRDLLRAIARLYADMDRRGAVAFGDLERRGGARIAA
jgi:hypothetical protein